MPPPPPKCNGAEPSQQCPGVTDKRALGPGSWKLSSLYLDVSKVSQVGQGPRDQSITLSQTHGLTQQPQVMTRVCRKGDTCGTHTHTHPASSRELNHGEPTEQSPRSKAASWCSQSHGLRSKQLFRERAAWWGGCRGRQGGTWGLGSSELAPGLPALSAHSAPPSLRQRRVLTRARKPARRAHPPKGAQRWEQGPRLPQTVPPREGRGEVSPRTPATDISLRTCGLTVRFLLQQKLNKYFSPSLQFLNILVL